MTSLEESRKHCTRRTAITLQRTLLIAVLSASLASCAGVHRKFEPGVPCEAATFRVSDDFAGARRGPCVVLADDHVRVTIFPEDDGYINDSPWYAFRLEPNASNATSGAESAITLDYRGGHHRYAPKTSRDGLTWTPLDPARVAVSDDGKHATLTLALEFAPLWIAAQELLTPAMYEAWNRHMSASGLVELSVLGQSRAGQDIMLLQTAPAADVLLLVGRQHPPEVTGAIAMLTFYETLLSDTELASRFRERFQVVAVPLMNPDGVRDGNWRHNLGGTDLNRDWGPFKQPETRLIRGLLDDLDADGKHIRIFVDFHSTQRNVFYTQDVENPTQPPHFTRRWLENAAARVPTAYEFENSENPTTKPGVAKNYIYRRYGIPALTYEIGDETDRPAIRQSARVFAEELMSLMLATEF